MSDPAAFTEAAREIERRAFDINGLALLGCDRIEFAVALYEHEKNSATLAPWTWPPAVQAALTREVEFCLAEKPGRAVRGITCGLGLVRGERAACVMVLHYAPPKAASCPLPRKEPTS
jgi:hypothetical protein